jgi:hypothetical protein
MRRLTPPSWYHDGRGPSLTCELCPRSPLESPAPISQTRCPACHLLIEAHELLPCQGERINT